MRLNNNSLTPLVLSFLFGLSIACGSSNNSGTATAQSQETGSTPLPTPTPIDPRPLLEESGLAMANLNSFHFRLEHKSGSTPLLPGLEIEEAAGDVVKPDKLSIEFSGSSGGFFIRSGYIAIGDDNYMMNPLRRNHWDKVPSQVSPLGFFNPSEGIAAIMTRIEQPTVVSASSDSYFIVGQLPAEALSSLLGETVKDSKVSVELRIDNEDYYLLETTLDGRVTATEEDGVVRVIHLSRFNRPVEIEPPS